MSAPTIRALRRDEREAWLELLDGWELRDGWRGRDFFRRPIEHDPSYTDENVWVAEEAGRLVACVQIFPLQLRLRGVAVPAGGIGSVFTRPEARAGGVASALLERSLRAMRERRMELSLLFASRHAFYARLGWSLWPRLRPLLLRTDATARPDPARAGVRFDPARDLADVVALHAAYSAGFDGTLVRDTESWRGSLVLAGNPGEEFRVARDAAGRIAAYARAIVLEGFFMIGEWARRPDAAEELADLAVGLMQPRAPDPLERADRPSAELRKLLVGPTPPDAALYDALGRRGVELKSFDERGAMLQCLDAEALARRTGAPRAAGEEPQAFLERLLPRDRFCFWPSDRF
jgi:GNAT superfamily N-acetyltransferase